jgi:hypothetical protein
METRVPVKETKMNARSFSSSALLKAIFLPLVAAALLLSACGSCPEPEQQLPDGVYITTVPVEDMANIGMPPARSCENAGTFALTVTGKKWSMFQTAAPGCIVKNPSWSGTWKLCGDEATFTGDGQRGSSYTYKWAFDGAELRFTRVNDTSATRIVWMTNYPWVLQK